MATIIARKLYSQNFLYVTLLICAVVFSHFLPLAEASSKNLPHAHLHRHTNHHKILDRRIDSNATGSLADAKAILSQAMKALVAANKLRLNNPQRNKYEFRSASEILVGLKLAPPLDYGQNGAALNSSLSARRHLHHRSTNNSSIAANASGSNGSFAYTIPTELADAARIVAESKPPVSSRANLTISSMPLPGTNDTNAMKQALIHPDGLHGWAPGVLPSIVSAQNMTDDAIEKRASSTFWLANIQQNGQSPFAPAGYKVWRNVMDYGATGNGVTDDTAAINAAISDGGRCGVNCGSSTIYPATVFFPPGTYLVSSPIIQYYNTEILGDPSNLPTIIAAASFVGLGVITSDVYIGTTEGWYLDTNNFLRSVKNFNMDITRTQLDAQVCAIHWQVAQGTSLENIYFTMSSAAGSTQQGIYMENGSGGWLSDLTFAGGLFGVQFPALMSNLFGDTIRIVGLSQVTSSASSMPRSMKLNSSFQVSDHTSAFLGNQQFTSRNLVFNGCGTALQISWDWAWTMQGVNIQNCGTGIIVVGGAGGPLSTYQGVGSLTLLDLTIQNTPVGIETSLFSTNSTAMLIENAYLYNVPKAVTNNQNGNTLLAGSTGVTTIDSWGFGMMTNSSGVRLFANAQNIPTMTRATSLVDQSGTQDMPQPAFFTRRRPTYTDIGFSQILDVTTFGVVGDGVTDNTAALNSVFAVAANLSSIVFIPFGVYKIYDTVRVPVGSRIIGQAWSQIMATGANFQDVKNPRVAVQVGQPGDVGVIEIQDMMFTVSGPTAGAILVEWNVHEISQGSVGLWDTHIRVGGAIGSDLQLANCPKLTGNVNPNCMAASLLFHMTSQSSGYLENSWMWVADHDMDVVTQDQIDIYSGRGLLIESQGPTWLYGTAVEHNVLYQYQVSGAEDLFMGVIQTESPYFQVAPAAPAPFTTALGLFANDPTFANCTAGSLSCAVSWAVRILDSNNIYVLGAGLYSWFQDYQQTICLAAEDCQDRVFGIEQSSNIWVYNLVTKGVVEMISPLNGVPTLSAANQNGFTASLLAWLEGANQTTGERTFPGFQLYADDFISTLNLPSICATALTASIYCNNLLSTYTTPQWAGSLGNTTLTNSVCDSGCGSSLASYFNTVQSACSGYNITGASPTMLGGYVWQGYNETCLKDPTTGQYCNDVIVNFTLVDDVSSMPKSEMCSNCYTERLQMMQASQYSAYAGTYASILAYVASACSLGTATTVLPPLVTPTPTPTPACASGNYYTTAAGNTCDTISLANNVSSAALFMGNSAIKNCSNITAGTTLCMPLSCQFTYVLKPNDTCISIDSTYDLGLAGIRGYNPWINFDCSGLQQSSTVYGHILCLSPQGGTYNSTATIGGYNSNPFSIDEYAITIVPPPQNATIAMGTTLNCGEWYTAEAGDDCAIVSVASGITADLLMLINPSLPTSNCSAGVIPNITYCVSPLGNWNTTSPDVAPADAGAAASAAATAAYWASVSAANASTSISMSSSSQSSTVSTTSSSIQTSSSSSSISSTSSTSKVSSTSSSSSSSPTSTAVYTYEGCWTDPGNPRALGSANYINHTTMTVELCASFCTPTYPVFGVEYGGECWCGDNMGLGSAAAASTDCNIVCAGNAAETCGGGSRLSVYYTGSGSLPQAATPSIVQSVANYAFYGCYTEGYNVRALSSQSTASSAMTVELCEAYCNGYTYFGVEYASECYCGYSLGNGSTLVGSSDCNMVCSGNMAELCGAGNRLLIYSDGS